MPTMGRENTPRMLRAALIVGACLLFGAAVNVGVAWGGQLVPTSYPAIPHDWLSVGAWRWPVSVPGDWPEMSNERRVWRTRVSDEETWAGGATFHEVIEAVGQSVASTSSRGNVDRFSLTISKCGLPFRSLATWSTDVTRVSSGGVLIVANTPQHHHGLRITYRGEDVSLPTRVLPAGFIANTLIYAAPAWGMCAGLGALKRGRRRRRGQCAGCGYDRSTLTPEQPCPECGVLLTASTHTAVLDADPGA